MSIENFQEYLKENGNSDLLVIPEFPEVSESDLYDNLNTVLPEWHTVNLKSMKYLIPTGKIPSNVDDAELKEIVERCTTFKIVDKKKLPIIWLLMQMRKLKIDEDFANSKILEYQTTLLNDTNKSDEDIWIELVQRYNGYVQILQELHTFAKDKDGNPLQFCYLFYSKREHLINRGKDSKNTTTNDINDDNDDEEDNGGQEEDEDIEELLEQLTDAELDDLNKTEGTSYKK